MGGDYAFPVRGRQRSQQYGLHADHGAHRQKPDEGGLMAHFACMASSARRVYDREVSGVKFVKSNLHGEHHPSEDAPPLAEDLGGGWFLLGAFDGLGGTGSDRYVRKHDGAERTGAYIASRVAARAVENAKRDL